MTDRYFLAAIIAAALIAWTGVPAAQAQNCTASDFGAVVDQTAQALRDLNVNGAKRFQNKLASLRDKHGLSQSDVEARASGMQDDKIEEFNRDIDSLVAQMDALSQTPNNKITCEKLDELKRVRDRLLTVMGQKSGYMLAKVDAEFEKGAAKPVTTAAAPIEPPAQLAPPPRPLPPVTPPDARAPAAPDTKPRAAETKAPPAPPVAPRPAERTAAVDPGPPPSPDRSPGSARVTRNTLPPVANDRVGSAPPPAPLGPGDADRPVSLAPPPPGAALPPPGIDPLPMPEQEGYTISDIREAGRGVFGTITAEFAGAINYAFQNYGHPNAYISGSEGGAAFVAGLRYGKGTLYRKSAPPTPIYWQGPSAGLDLGAEGSNALFLVYNLDDPDAIYGRFSGVGGSAYVAGGVGLNVLGKGRVVMVPIRSGLGLRIGANLAYLKFTERQTWNPF